ncbi:MAG TPA: CinA family protein [Propionibacteriaceae bacterium]|nr:CinA family protein [Propionibacteriaceae bacterium]
MSVSELASGLVAQLTQRGLTLATCESLTGGAIAATITDVPGASAIFRGGLVTYASDLKASLAGVDSTWIAEHGVINERTAVEMAVGTRILLGTDIAVSCTGVAGPDPQDGVAPGRVWIAVASALPGGPDALTTQRLDVDGDRAQVRSATIDAALELVLSGFRH